MSPTKTKKIAPDEILTAETLRAIDPERPLAISQMAEDLYRASSGPNTSYTVDIEQPYSCTCPGFQYHQYCRHIRRVLLILGIYSLPIQAKNIDIEWDPAIGTYIQPQIKYEDGTYIEKFSTDT